MEYGVTVQLEGSDVAVGTLFANVRRGRESASFRYDLLPSIPLLETRQLDA